MIVLVPVRTSPITLFLRADLPANVRITDDGGIRITDDGGVRVTDS